MFKLILLFCIASSFIYGQYDFTKLVTNTGDPTIYTNEPSAASNGNFIAVGCNYNSGTTINKVGFFYSTDNGTSWTQGDIPKGFNGNSVDDSDPSLAFDAAGNLYYVYLSALSSGTTGIFINKSTNNGQTWISYGVVSISGSNSDLDKPYICIKNYSPVHSKIFIAYRERNGITNMRSIKLAHINSEDLGELNFQISMIRTGAEAYYKFESPIPHCTSDGKLYVTYIGREPVSSINKYIISIARSDNDGLYFQPSNIVGEYAIAEHIGFDNGEAFNWYGDNNLFTGKYFRVNGFPTIASINNTLYVAYCQKINGFDKILLRYSTNYGLSWTQINTDNITGNNFFPWLSTTMDNKICLTYYNCDNIYLPNNSKIYAKIFIYFPEENTGDGFAIDEFNFRESFNFLGQTFIGDYINISSYANDRINILFTSNATVSTSKPTVIKCASIPNKVKYEIQAFQDDIISSNDVGLYIEGESFVEPMGNDFLEYMAYSYKEYDFVAQQELMNFNYRHRNSNILNNIGNIFSLNYENISLSPEPLALNYYSVLPLTINSNFEGAQNVGSYNLTWTNASQTIPLNFSSTPYRAFLYEPTNQDRYNISAPASYPFDNTSWSFRNWSDGSTNPQKTNVAVTSSTPNEYIANYKGIQRSANANAYQNNSQRKFIRSKYDGKFHSVYSSMGKIWYETKTGEEDWVIMNNVNPIVSADAKNPSIVEIDNNYVAICYQENFGGNSSLKAVVYNYSSNQIVGEPYNLESSIDSYSLDNPIAVEFYNGQSEHLSYLFFVYKAFSSSGGFGPEPGLVYSYYTYNHSTKQLTLLNWNNITGTNINFSNPSLASCELSNFYAAKVFYLAYQEDNFTNGTSKIWYQTVDPTSSTEINHTSSSNISLNSGYTKNYKPNLITLPGTDVHSRLTWVGERTTEYEVEGEEQLRQITEKRTVFRGSSGSSFWNFGSDVRAAAIQKSNIDPNYFVSWNQADGKSKSMNNTSFSTIRTIDEDGQQIDVCNGETIDDLYGMIFNNSGVPYSFSMTNNLSSYFGSQSKETYGGNIFAGREGTVTKVNTCFFYTIGDVVVDGAKIKFKEITESTSINSNDDVKQYLETEPFELNDNSIFIYSVQYGSTLNADNTFNENEFINYKVKLIDVNTNTILTVFDDITFNHENLQPYASLQYNVNTNGIGNKTVKLVLDIEDNFNGVYSVTSIIDDAELLQKSNRVNIGLGDNINITSYDISQNYPNPFNPSTTIRYQIPQDGMVTLKVYDILGREVKTLVNEVKTKGRYEVNFDASNLASGLYIYEIKSGSYKASKKMT